MESTEDLPKLNLQPPHPTYSPLSHPKQNQKPPAWLFLLERGDFKKERKKEGVKRGIWYKTEKGEGEGGRGGGQSCSWGQVLFKTKLTITTTSAVAALTGLQLPH